MVRPREVDITQGLSQTNEQKNCDSLLLSSEMDHKPPHRNPRTHQEMPSMLPVCRMRLSEPRLLGLAESHRVVAVIVHWES